MIGGWFECRSILWWELEVWLKTTGWLIDGAGEFTNESVNVDSVALPCFFFFLLITIEACSQWLCLFLSDQV